MRRYYSLLDCIMWTTDLYRYIQESTDAMIWASATSVSYDELTFTDFSFVGANCFVCTVRYKGGLHRKLVAGAEELQHAERLRAGVRLSERRRVVRRGDGRRDRINCKTGADAICASAPVFRIVFSRFIPPVQRRP